uniref:Capsid protein n=1 Tax=Lymantria dispar multicapsid nuclear polyhedrosis virus TaxID=10449 RepID=A0A6H0F358_NPVLD|nr:capsid protein [Lymantria dispar multiple nucleopolyhedrovirus]
MALVSGALSTNRLRNYCVFGAVQPFDNCRAYGSPCSPDSTNNDGWFICDYHSSIRFKIEKMVLPIPDAEGNIYNRTVGKSLVNHKTLGAARVLIPTRDNYKTVLNLNSMSLAEQLVTHMIYDNVEEQEAVCKALQHNENFQTETYRLAEDMFNRTSAILAMTNPRRYCSQVNSNYARIWTTDDVNVAGNVFESMPPFLKNLINVAVAPEQIMIDEETLVIRNCPTCNIDDSGLVANVQLYNPVVPRYRSTFNENVLHVENVLKFKGNANALQKSLSRYEPYPIVVPLMLGTQTLNTSSAYKQFTVPTRDDFAALNQRTGAAAAPPAPAAAPAAPGPAPGPAAELEAGGAPVAAR